MSAIFACNFKTGIALAIGAVLLGPCAWSKASLMDPGTLISVEKKDGKTIEKYSDGLTSEIFQNESIKESKPADDYTMEDTIYFERMRPEIRDDDILMAIELAFMHGQRDWNDSRVQARLRQYSSFYLKINEPEKAEPLAKLYLHSQLVLQVPGEALAFAQRNLGEVETALGKYEKAIPLLDAAAAYYKNEPDHLEYCKILTDLGYALSKTNHLKEGRTCLGEARNIAAHNGLDFMPERRLNSQSH